MLLWLLWIKRELQSPVICITFKLSCRHQWELFPVVGHDLQYALLMETNADSGNPANMESGEVGLSAILQHASLLSDDSMHWSNGWKLTLIQKGTKREEHGWEVEIIAALDFFFFKHSITRIFFFCSVWLFFCFFFRFWAKRKVEQYQCKEE